MESSRMKQLDRLGQSLWIDYIRRDFISGGELRKIIEEYGLKGMTSNPAIFEKAILESNVYREPILAMRAAGKDAGAIYEALSQEDVQSAADVFRPVYDRTGGKDGYVSLEVNPHLAHDTGGTVGEARRLWNALDRPNVMIKIPATREGLPAIHQMVREGINVNATLIFGVERYRQVAQAYMKGIEDRIADHQPVDHVASVASFFLSRIDTLIDPMLQQRQSGAAEELAKKVYGQVAVASAKTAYQSYKRLFESGQFAEMRDKGAAVQRLLWASTGTKNPQFSDLKYVEPLIGQDTVNTLPVDTFQAFIDHGNPTPTLEEQTAEAKAVLRALPTLGIDLDGILDRLENEGIQKFIEPFEKLLFTIETFQ